jgi:hypothetical protein
MAVYPLEADDVVHEHGNEVNFVGMDTRLKRCHFVSALTVDLPRHTKTVHGDWTMDIAARKGTPTICHGHVYPAARISGRATNERHSSIHV